MLPVGANVQHYGPPCLRLLGFVPVASVSMEYNTSSSLFVASASHALAETARRRQIRNRERDRETTETRDARVYFYEADRLLAGLVLAAERKQVVSQEFFIEIHFIQGL